MIVERGITNYFQQFWQLCCQFQMLSHIQVHVLLPVVMYVTSQVCVGTWNLLVQAMSDLQEYRPTTLHIMPHNKIIIHLTKLELVKHTVCHQSEASAEGRHWKYWRNIEKRHSRGMWWYVTIGEKYEKLARYVHVQLSTWVRHASSPPDWLSTKPGGGGVWPWGCLEFADLLKQ